MEPWSKRPREIRTLFNPAFCGLVLARGIEGFYEAASLPMPFSLTLLLLPLCLHKQTRDILKNKKKSYFIKILQDNPEIRVGFANRARGFFPYTMEGFAYLALCNAIDIDRYGGVVIKDKAVNKTASGTQDTKDCQSTARSLGRKLGQSSNKVTIYAMLGIRP